MDRKNNLRPILLIILLMFLLFVVPIIQANIINNIFESIKSEVPQGSSISPELYKSINSSKLYIITIIFNVVINLADVLGITFLTLFILTKILNIAIYIINTKSLIVLHSVNDGNTWLREESSTIYAMATMKKFLKRKKE